MASQLWIYQCLLSIIFTFTAAQDNITCTFTNGKDCSNLLDKNSTIDYVIDKEEINRTGIKIIFGESRGVEFLEIESGGEIENRVQVINITRGSLNHLVNLSCSQEIKVDQIKLNPVIQSHEIQIDFVKGCGNESHPIIIQHISYEVVEIKERNGSLLSETTSEERGLGEDKESYDLNSTTPMIYLSTFDLQERPESEKAKTYDPPAVESTVRTSGHLLLDGLRPTTPLRKIKLVATGRPVTVTRKNGIPNEKKKKDEKKKKINFKVGASQSLASRISFRATTAILTLFLILYYI